MLGSGVAGSGPVVGWVKADRQRTDADLMPVPCRPRSGSARAPLSTATNTAGTAIKVGGGADPIAIAPDGKTAYVVIGYYEGHEHVTPSTPPTTPSAMTSRWATPGGMTLRCDCDDRLRGLMVVGCRVATAASRRVLCPSGSPACALPVGIAGLTALRLVEGGAAVVCVQAMVRDQGGTEVTARLFARLLLIGGRDTDPGPGPAALALSLRRRSGRVATPPVRLVVTTTSCRCRGFVTDAAE